MYYVDFSGYEDIDESNMDPSLAQHSKPLNTSSLDAPPLPYHGKQKQTIKQNNNAIATPGPSNFKEGMATDTYSDYEYVSNSVEKNNASRIYSCKNMITITVRVRSILDCRTIFISIDVSSRSLKDKLISCQRTASNMTKI